MGFKAFVGILKNGDGIAASVFWNFFGNILARTSNLLVSIFVAYFLTKAEYGQLGFLRSTLNTFVIFGTFGFGVAATKFFADAKYKDKVFFICYIDDIFLIIVFL
jgi:O-antigen/teichoic acid export membrane protein